MGNIQDYYMADILPSIFGCSAFFVNLFFPISSLFGSVHFFPGTCSYTFFVLAQKLPSWQWFVCVCAVALCGRWWWWYLKQNVCIHWIYMATSYSQKACYSVYTLATIYAMTPPYPTIFRFPSIFFLSIFSVFVAHCSIHAARRHCCCLIHSCYYHTLFFSRQPPSVSLRFIRIKKAKMNCF